MIPRRPEHPARPPAARRAIVAALALWACSATAVHAYALPLQPQVLEYRVAWNGVPAAQATVEISPTRADGQEKLIVEAKARTNRLVDVFWTFRGTARTTLLADQLTPERFVYDRRMAGKPYRTDVDFARRTSVYIKGNRRRELSAEAPDLIDPITAVFRARASGAGSGDTLRYDVWTGEKRYRVVLEVGQPEDIDVPAGRFRALRVVPRVWHLGEAPRMDDRLRQATVWVSDDPRRLLLRIRSEVFIGAVTLDLVRVGTGA